MVFVLCVILMIFFVNHWIPSSQQSEDMNSGLGLARVGRPSPGGGSVRSEGSSVGSFGSEFSSPQSIETMGFDETEVNADVGVISFRIQTSGPDDSKARYEFLKQLHDIETQCNEREIPFQLIPKSQQPFVFVQTSPLLVNPQAHLDIVHQPTATAPRNKVYFITQDFSLPLLLSRSPPIPLFMDTLASNGAMISEIAFPISAQRKNAAEKASLLRAVADAKSKAVFLAQEQQRHVVSISEITPIQVKVEPIKDTNLELLLTQLQDQQSRYQQHLQYQQLSRDQMNPNPYLSAMPAMPLNPMFHPGSLPSTPSMEPLRVFGSALVPKKVLVTTQVKVRFTTTEKT